MKNFKYYWESEKDDSIRISVPGFLRNEISVKLSSASVRIDAEKKSSRVEKGKGFHREESFARSFHKHIALPRRISPRDFEVSITDGEVLLKHRVQGTFKKKKESHL